MNIQIRPIHHRLNHFGYAFAVLPLLRWQVAVHAVPAEEPWRYRCPRCAADLWPVACGPSGRCRACGTPIGAPPYTVETLAIAALGLLLLRSTMPVWELAAHLWWTAGMLILALVDAAVLRLPHRLTLATSAGTALMLMAAGAPGSSWRNAIICPMALAGGYALIHVAFREDLGLGDVAVAIPTGLILGWHEWRLVIAAVLLGHITAVAAIPIRRLAGRARTPVPLGTYLVAASFTVLTVAGVPT